MSDLNINNSVNAIEIALNDLLQAGVNDVLSETPLNYYENKLPSHFLAPKGSDSNVKSKPLLKIDKATSGKDFSKSAYGVSNFEQKTSINKIITPVKEISIVEINPQDVIWLSGDKQLPYTAIISSNAKHGDYPLEGKAKLLFEKMLQAISLNISDFNFVVIKQSLENGMSINNDEDLSSKVKEIISKKIKELASQDKPLLIIGEETSQLILGKKLMPSRQKEHRFMERDGVVLHHPQTLVMQSLMKRMAWQDLLKFKQKL